MNDASNFYTKLSNFKCRSKLSGSPQSKQNKNHTDVLDMAADENLSFIFASIWALAPAGLATAVGERAGPGPGHAVIVHQRSMWIFRTFVTRKLIKPITSLNQNHEQTVAAVQASRW
jgi:hypothetical protein